MREDWEFQFTAKEVAEAAEKVSSYHRGRQQHWDERARNLATEIRETGVELKEITVTGGSRFEAHVNNSLGNQLSEAKSKADSHKMTADKYADWGFALRTLAPSQTLSLDVTDVTFFELGRPE